MSSKLDIINASFILLGHRSVNNLGDNSGEDVKKASKLYDIFYPAYLTRYSWRFAIKQFELSQVANAPEVSGYNYAYQLPSDYLSIYKVDPQAQYEIYGTYLYINISSDLKLYYTYKVSEGILPEYFVEWIIEEFAALFAMPITQQVELAQLWGQSAQLKLNRAIALDSQSQTSLSIISNPLGQAKYAFTPGL